MVTNALEIEEVGFMLRQATALHPPRFFFRKTGLVNAFHNGPHRRRRVFVNIHKPPFLVCRNVPDRCLTNFGPSIKDRHSFKHAIWRMVFATHANVPHLSAGIHLLDQLRDLHVIELWIATIRLRFHIVPPHVLLAFGEQPGGLVCH